MICTDWSPTLRQITRSCPSTNAAGYPRRKWNGASLNVWRQKIHRRLITPFSWAAWNPSISLPRSTNRDFYRGVKVKAGHVAANLVLDRPNDMNKVLDALWQRRHVLVSGPSGAGKSALVWLVTTAIAGQLRWFQITGMATTAHAEAIIRFVRARRPTEMSPIGLVFDEVGSVNSNLWDVLVRELRGIPALYFLGSVRQEDVTLVVNQSDTVFIPVILDENLAQTVWEKLSAGNHTNWTHWREPFERSEGLMLEYVHLLTQGKRLAAGYRRTDSAEGNTRTARTNSR